MKDIIVTLVENIFYVGSDEDITLKKLVIMLFKVILFLATVGLILWIAIQLKK